MLMPPYAVTDAAVMPLIAAVAAADITTLIVITIAATLPCQASMIC